MDYMMIFKIRWRHLKAAFTVKNCKKKKKKDVLIHRPLCKPCCAHISTQKEPNSEHLQGI